MGWLGLTLAWLELGCWWRIRLMRYERFGGFLWVVLNWDAPEWGCPDWGCPEGPRLSWVCSLTFGLRDLLGCCGLDGDEPESLILAQIERWRHA